MMKPMINKHGFKAYSDQDGILDFISSLPENLKTDIYKTLDHGAGDSQSFFMYNSIPYFLIKAASQEDPGICLVETIDLPTMIEFIEHVSDNLMESKHRKELIAELLELHNEITK